MKNIIFYSLVFLLFISCQGNVEIEGFDGEAWRSDKKACKGIRQQMEPTLKDVKSQFKGLSEYKILEILGKPDQQELYERNQRFFMYFIDPAAECKNTANIANQTKLVLRFSATGRVSEIMIDENL